MNRRTEPQRNTWPSLSGKEGKCMTQFLDCVVVRDGKAATVVDAVNVTMKKSGVPMTKVIGLGSDGSSVMASDIRGVNGMMKQLNPFLVFVHCVAHCLNLAVSQACNGISEMAALQNVIVAVYNLQLYKCRSAITLTFKTCD